MIRAWNCGGEIFQRWAWASEVLQGLKEGLVVTDIETSDEGRTRERTVGTRLDLSQS